MGPLVLLHSCQTASGVCDHRHSLQSQVVEASIRPDHHHLHGGKIHPIREQGAMLVPLGHRLSSDSESTSTLACRFVLPRWTNFCFTAAERFLYSLLLRLDVTQQKRSFGVAVLTPLPSSWLLLPPSPLPRGDRSARSTTPDTALVCPALMSSVVSSQARLHIIVGLLGCKSGR